jgi:hypothetical protein
LLIIIKNSLQMYDAALARYLEDWSDMLNALIKCLTLMIMLGLFSACAEVKEAGRSIGHTTRNVTTDIGHGSRDTVKALGRGTKRVFNSVTEDPEQPSDSGN